MFAAVRLAAWYLCGTWPDKMRKTCPKLFITKLRVGTSDLTRPRSIKTVQGKAGYVPLETYRLPKTDDPPNFDENNSKVP